MVMNVPANAVKNNNNNNNDQAGGDAPPVERGQDAEPQSSTSKGETSNASNYDATKARKSKRKSDSEVWQDNILRCLKPVDVPEPAKKDYIEPALGTVASQMKENLSHNEILDLIEDIQGMVNRACREKCRRIEMANQVSNNNQIRPT